ncbi:MAG: hypothetical protein Q9162_003242 [Coniocarpon cinnabarinum]
MFMAMTDSSSIANDLGTDMVQLRIATRETESARLIATTEQNRIRAVYEDVDKFFVQEGKKEAGWEQSTAPIMVLYKRKPFHFILPPNYVPPDTQCWLIRETGEIFPAYESYLQRLAYYNQRKFTDPISGESNLTFFEALEKEKQGSQDIDADFPEALREPILRKCQFSQQSRLTDLVASLFHDFKDNIVAGEQVQFQDAETGTRATGLLKERTVFFDRPDLTRYFVQIPNEPGQKPNVACVDRLHIWRKPRAFTKFNLQRFLRHTIHRERYEGAPWLVKEPYARQYRLETDIPPHLTQEAIAAGRRLQNGLRRNRIDELPHAFMVHNNHVMIRPGAKPTQHDVQYVHDKFDGVKFNGEQVLQMRPAPQQRPPLRQAPEQRLSQPLPPPPIKYPIEDLDLPPNKKASKRPTPHDFTTFEVFPTAEGSGDRAPIDMASVGPLLETWNSLTVFGEFFQLDGFVWDDFVGAMMVTSETRYCELFYEMHCAVLLRLVDDDSGDILSGTLKKAGRVSTDSAHSSETSTSPSAGSAAQTGDQDVEMQDSSTDTPLLARHRAADMITQDQWIEMIQSRKFQDGAWALIIVGVLNLLSSHDRYKDRCERILCHLAPTDKPATESTAFQQYMSMSISLRAQALELVTGLITETKPFKDHIEVLVFQSTETRKEKTSLQSQAKSIRSELARLEYQEKLLRPDKLNGQKQPGTDSQLNGEADSPPQQATNGQEDDQVSGDSGEFESEDEDMPRSSRRISSRAADLKTRKRQLDENKHTQEETKELADYRKVLRDFEETNAQKEELDDKIQRYEDELRENSCHRTRLMGRDRFLNRYIWFERNGMPFEGESDSTPYGYANGRLWVQGPDPMECPGMIDLNEDEEREYQAKFNMTIQQRRDAEEGTVQLSDTSQWAYYDDPAEVDQLIDWLDSKGERERQLKKELAAWRKPLQSCMNAMRDHRREIAEELSKLEDRPVGIATRKKLIVDLDRIRYPCLNWENVFYRERYSQRISDGPAPRRTKKRGTKDSEGASQPQRRGSRRRGPGRPPGRPPGRRSKRTT